MDEAQEPLLLFLAVHVHTRDQAKDYKGYQCECHLAVGPCYEKPVPVDLHHGHAPQHASQQCPQSYLSPGYVPLSPKNRLLMKINRPKALYPEIEYVKGHQYGRRLDDGMNDKQNRPHRMRKNHMRFSCLVYLNS